MSEPNFCVNCGLLHYDDYHRYCVKCGGALAPVRPRCDYATGLAVLAIVMAVCAYLAVMFK